jgi:hypothetical protein
LHEEHIYFEQNMGERKNIYFGRHFACLKYFTYHLLLVPLLAQKQHILLPDKFRNVCYSLAQIYFKSVYLNLFGWRGREVYERNILRWEQATKLWKPLL